MVDDVVSLDYHVDPRTGQRIYDADPVTGERIIRASAFPGHSPALLVSVTPFLVLGLCFPFLFDALAIEER